MPNVADFLTKFPESERVDLANAIDAGLHEAQLAAQCLTDPTLQTQDVAQLLAYLTQVINQFSAARYLVRRRA